MAPYTKVEILTACCCIAGADGDTSENEARLLNRMAKEIGVGQASLGAMIDRAETDPEFYQQHFTVLKAEPTATLAILFQVALADGALDERENGVLYSLAKTWACLMRFTRKLKKPLSVKRVSDLTKKLALSDQTLAFRLSFCSHLQRVKKPPKRFGGPTFHN